MKVVFVAPRYHTNQVAAVRSLQAAGHEVDFHVNRVGKTEDHSLLTPKVFANSRLSRMIVRVMGDGGGDIKWHAPGFFQYMTALRVSNPDVVVIRNPSRLFSLTAALAARLQGRRILFYTQTPLYSNWSLLKRVLSRCFMRVFKASWMTPLLGNSKHGARLKGMSYVPFPVAMNKRAASKRVKSATQPIRFLMVGKYNKRKNAKLLIEALAESQIEFSLTIIGECGDDAQRELKRKIEQQVFALNITDKVSLRSSVPFEQMTEVYQQHDVFVLPARNEPASISVLEAVAAGLPAICSTTCGTACYIRIGQTGFVFESDNKISLITALRSAADMFTQQSPDLIAQQCLESAAENFSEKAYLQAFLTTLRKP